jgi:cold shock CspA family protein
VAAGGGGGRKPTPTGKAYTGTVKNFHPDKNFGFIDCPEVKAEYGNDVFTRGEYLQDKNVGDVVYFELGLSDKGQPQALNVVPFESGEEPPAKKAKVEPN